MNYWHIQLHCDDIEFEEKDLLKQTSLIGIGDKNVMSGDFILSMEINDIVLVRKGQKAIALVRILSEVKDISENKMDRLDWFRYRREVEVLDYATNMDDFPYTRGSLKKATDKKTDSYKYIDKWYIKNQNKYNINGLIPGTFKLKKLFISDSRKILGELELDCTNDGENPLPIIILAGKNGTGKTTILEYLSNCNMKNDDYIDIFSVIQSEYSYTFSLTDPSPVVKKEADYDLMPHIDKFTSKRDMPEYDKDKIEYLSVNTHKIEDIKTFIIEKYKKKARELDSFKKALKEIQIFIDNIFFNMNITFNIYDINDVEKNNEKVIFTNNSGNKFEIESLSTGEKTLLSKVLYLYFKDIKNKIILIDEPELSLHPDWQTKVLNIYENFAKSNNCQIIIATHSPHIIGSAKNEYIRVLYFNENKKIEIINNVLAYGRDIEWVLKEVMGAKSTRDEHISTKIKECQHLLNSEKYDDAENKINQLESIIGQNDNEVMSLRNSLFFEKN